MRRARFGTAVDLGGLSGWGQCPSVFSTCADVFRVPRKVPTSLSSLRASSTVFG